MAKFADKYYKVDSWSIIEEGFDPEYSECSESVFSLANGYMGSRGYFEEGYSGQSLIGNYFNGIYEQHKQEGAHYKGIVDITEFMVNAVDWLYLRIEAEGECLDLAVSKIKDFRRTLDLRTGLLTRSFVWCTRSGKEIYLEFQRFFSMKHTDTAVQRLIMGGKDQVEIQIRAGMDFSNVHQTTGKNYWICSNPVVEENYISMIGTTQVTGQKVCTSCLFHTDQGENQSDSTTEYEEITLEAAVQKKQLTKTFRYLLKPGEEQKLTRIVKNTVLKDSDGYGETPVTELFKLDFEELFEENRLWWTHVWDHSDIVIEGDEENQQGIRFCIFQMYQTYQSEVKGGNIGAKGLTGEAYNGNSFWDTETYCLPFYIFNDVESARKLLLFRYETLDEARERAKDLDCKGAFYPIATISGKECCNLWQHASLQMQASTGVAYGIWLYEKLTGDRAFVYEYGLEMLIEICRMLATRGDYSENGTRYGYYSVMGPDEFQMMVNHNCYTNLMAKLTFHYTNYMLRQFEEADQAQYKELVERLKLDPKEQREWSKMEKAMYLPYDEETSLFEQHQGFFLLPHLDVNQIPVEDFPLYNNWSYDRIYRNDMIKQPDVLMFLLLFNSSFTKEQLEVNYNYYEPRCIHESSLSPSVHSILASQLGKDSEAFEFFHFATRMDLDNYNRNTREGLHTTSIAAAWMNIVYGFGGLRSDGPMLSLNPSIPDKWQRYTFRLAFHNDTIVAEVDRENVWLYTLNGSKIQVMLYGQQVILGKERLQTALGGDRK